MKGLKRYLARHGRHFTVKLAMDVIDCKWDANEVKKASDAMVYYNVSKSTLGDMVYFANLFAYDLPKRRCIEYALEMVGNVYAEGRAFNAWITLDEDIDLGKYI